MNVKTFDGGGDVRPIEQILDRTLHVKALRARLGRALDELANADSTIENLREWAAALESERDDLRAKLEKMAAFLTVTEEELDARQVRHDAATADLRAKLDAANAELHDLRIRVGLVAGLEAQVGELREMLAARGAALGLGQP